MAVSAKLTGIQSMSAAARGDASSLLQAFATCRRNVRCWPQDVDLDGADSICTPSYSMQPTIPETAVVVTEVVRLEVAVVVGLVVCVVVAVVVTVVSRHSRNSSFWKRRMAVLSTGSTVSHAVSILRNPVGLHDSVSRSRGKTLRDASAMTVRIASLAPAQLDAFTRWTPSTAWHPKSNDSPVQLCTSP